MAIPTTPILLSPANNVLKQPLDLTLQWSESVGVETYELQVATDNQFLNLVKDVQWIVGESYALTGLVKGIVFYWRVRARNVEGVSEYSSAYNFRTIIDASVYDRNFTTEKIMFRIIRGVLMYKIGSSQEWEPVIFTEHNILTNRQEPDCHPVVAITGLQEILNSKPTIVPAPAHFNSQGIAGQEAFDDDYVYKCIAPDRWIKQIGVKNF